MICTIYTKLAHKSSYVMDLLVFKELSICIRDISNKSRVEQQTALKYLVNAEIYPV